MPAFVDRHRELTELNALLQNPRRAEFVLAYGRRRVGKTTLLTHWAQAAGRPFLYWVARQETTEATRQSLARALWRWAYPEAGEVEPPRFASWEHLFEQLVRMLGDQPVIIVLDEFSHAAETDKSLPSHVQVLWDQHLQHRVGTILVLAGSHIGMMVDLQALNAPLYGRFTAQLPIKPLPYAALTGFFPQYSAEERVFAYAVLGGIPAYLQAFDPEQNVSQNIRRHLFRSMGMFRADPLLLISELVTRTNVYTSVLSAVALGAHTPSEIGGRTGQQPSNLDPYLKQLQKLGLIERRLPALVPPAERPTTTRSRYHLSDPYLRFYFRFIEPHLESIELDLVDALWDVLHDQVRAFVGAHAFEELCREWVLTQARARRLPFAPEIVGSHWSAEVQLDVVAVNWRKKQLLVGECKWGKDGVDLATVRERLAKEEAVRQQLPEGGADWTLHYAFFSRTGFTAEARARAVAERAILVDLSQLDADLLAASPLTG